MVQDQDYLLDYATHHSLDDISILRSIPDIQILAPCDNFELKAFLHQALESDCPTYIRIGKKGEPVLTKNSANPRIGRANILSEGNENLILGIGPILDEAIKAKMEIRDSNNKTSIVSMGSVKPLDTNFLEGVVKQGFKRWIVLEEHSIIGGLGS